MSGRTPEVIPEVIQVDRGRERVDIEANMAGEQKAGPKHQRAEYTHYIQTPWEYNPALQETHHHHMEMHQTSHQQQVHQTTQQAHHQTSRHMYQSLEIEENAGDEEEDEEQVSMPLQKYNQHQKAEPAAHRRRSSYEGQNSQGQQVHQGLHYQLKPLHGETPEAPLWVQGENEFREVSPARGYQDVEGQHHQSQGQYQGVSTSRSRSSRNGGPQQPQPSLPAQRYVLEESSRVPTIMSDGSIQVNTTNMVATGNGNNKAESRARSCSRGGTDGGNEAPLSASARGGYVGETAMRPSRYAAGGVGPNTYRPKDTATSNTSSSEFPSSYPQPTTRASIANTQGYQAATRQEGLGCCGFILTLLSWLLIIVTCPFSLCLCIKVVQEYERAVIFRLGRLMSGGAKGPGLFFIIPCMDSYTKVDLRTVSFDVPPQEVLSKDSVTVAVDAVVYYRVQNATISVTNVEDAARSTRLLAATNLRNVLGTKNLSEILADRENISHRMQVNLDEATDPWGVKVERVEIKDVRLPVQLQRAMAAEAEASREARAKVIAAEGEHKAARALKDAADVISESPSALQLRYLQTLNAISAEKNSTIIFPLPIDFLSVFMRKHTTSNTVEAE